MIDTGASIPKTRRVYIESVEDATQMGDARVITRDPDIAAACSPFGVDIWCQQVKEFTRGSVGAEKKSYHLSPTGTGIAGFPGRFDTRRMIDMLESQELWRVDPGHPFLLAFAAVANLRALRRHALQAVQLYTKRCVSNGPAHTLVPDDRTDAEKLLLVGGSRGRTLRSEEFAVTSAAITLGAYFYPEQTIFREGAMPWFHFEDWCEVLQREGTGHVCLHDALGNLDDYPELAICISACQARRQIALELKNNERWKFKDERKRNRITKLGASAADGWRDNTHFVMIPKGADDRKMDKVVAFCESDQ